MSIFRALVEGRPATVADFGDGMVKIVFDDGGIRFAVPAPEEEWSDLLEDRGFDPSEARDPQGRWTALAGSQGHPALISTSRIMKPGRTEETKAQFAKAKTTYTRVDVAQMRQDPRVYEENVALFKDGRFYPGMRKNELKGSTDDQANAVVERMRSNLVFLANAVKDGKVAGIEFEPNRLWYVGAHNIAERESKATGVDIASASGVIAALSPQMDWDKNVYFAHAVFDALSHPDRGWDEGMAKTAKAIWKGANAKLVSKFEGKTLGEIDDPVLAGMWIRTWDEAHGERQYRAVLPNGDFGELRRNDPARKGEVGEPSRPGWGTTDAVGNAVAAYRSGGNAEVLSEAMGGMHKVRSFFNNILDPHSANEDVTIDTHAVGAAWLQPYSGSDVPVYHALKTNPGIEDKPEGFVGASGSEVSGIKGTYPLYADAYRLAARDLKIEPRELQSITWSAKRALFSERGTTGPKVKAAVDAIWREFHDGRLSLEAAQNEVVRKADELIRPAREQRA